MQHLEDKLNLKWMSLRIFLQTLVFVRFISIAGGVMLIQILISSWLTEALNLSEKVNKFITTMESATTVTFFKSKLVLF